MLLTMLKAKLHRATVTGADMDYEGSIAIDRDLLDESGILPHEQVDVLNINELANALKPIVLPGEIMRVFILKEGKEYNQGVAYLDDGTMVVVDNARKMISKTIDIVVTSVLQTTAGKMIFGRFIETGVGPQAMAAPQPVRAQAAAAPQASS